MEAERVERLKRYVGAVREALLGIESILQEVDEGKPAGPYERRKELLYRIHAEGGLEKEQLMHAVREAGTAYQWIGQQVKKGYLEVPSKSQVKYQVTPRAVRELELTSTEKDETALYASMAEEAFSEDWDSPEDAIYDRL